MSLSDGANRAASAAQLARSEAGATRSWAVVRRPSVEAQEQAEHLDVLPSPCRRRGRRRGRVGEEAEPAYADILIGTQRGVSASPDWRRRGLRGGGRRRGSRRARRPPSRAKGCVGQRLVRAADLGPREEPHRLPERDALLASEALDLVEPFERGL